MKVLTTLHDIHDAEAILHCLSKHGVRSSIEGKHTHSLGVYIPNGLAIVVHGDEQFRYAQKLLRQFDQKNSDARSGRSLNDAQRASKLDKFFVAILTLVITVTAVWIIHSAVN